MGASACGNLTPSEKLFKKYGDKLPEFIVCEQMKLLLKIKIQVL